jgi:hypothetical protein
MIDKPEAQLIGQDGNVYNLMGICSRALKEAGYVDEAREMLARVTQSGSYDKALQIMGEYVDIV